LLRGQHTEFNDFLQSVNSSQIKRSQYLKVTWEFKMKVFRARFGFCVLLVLLARQAADGQSSPAPPQPSRDLTQESLEDLLNVEVTSVSKKEQKLSRAAAAVFVLSEEDIQRSGATTIPDLLRMVPGIDVAQINGNTWAVSARGLNGQFSNELLVLVDGRNAYTPTFGGVFWDTWRCRWTTSSASRRFADLEDRYGGRTR
jgi:outer membrane receptor for monomeric catechols